jgi:hypothetical protein
MPSLEKNKQGQHAMEYVILLILIMAGIIISGPYVLRSWNANLKRAFQDLFPNQASAVARKNGPSSSAAEI